MINSINKYLLEASHKFDLGMLKIEAVTEAIDRELEINYAEAELKVIEESGTDADLSYLYEEANNGLVDSVKKAIIKIRDMIVKFFSDMKTRIITRLRDKDSTEVLDKMEKKAKLFPLLGRKKVIVEDYNKEEKEYNKAMSLMTKVRAKFKSGQEVSSDEIDNIEDDYDENRKKALGIAAAITITLAAAITFLKKFKGDVVNNIIERERESTRVCDEVLNDVEKDPTIARKIADATASINKTQTETEVSILTNTLTQIKKAFRGFGKTEIDVKQAIAKESTDSDSMDIDQKEIDKAVDNSTSNSNSNGSMNEEGDDPIDSLYNRPEDTDDPWDDVTSLPDDDDDDRFDGFNNDRRSYDEYGCCSESASTYDSLYNRIFKDFPGATSQGTKTSNEKIVSELFSRVQNVKESTDVYESLLQDIEDLY